MSLAALFVQLLNGLAGASTLFLIAAGLSLIFGVTRIVNFAHGSLFMLGSYIAYSLITRIGGTGVGYWAAVLLAGIAVAIVGAWIVLSLVFRVWVSDVSNFKTGVGFLTAFLVLGAYIYFSVLVFVLGVQLDELLRKKDEGRS